MKAFVKFPLLSVLCFLAMGTTFSTAALAGSTTTSGADGESSSSIGVSFSPTLTNVANNVAAVISSNPQLAAALSQALTLAASDVGTGGSMSSVGGVSVTLSAEQASIIAQAISASAANGGIQQALEQQLVSELSSAGVTVNVTALAEALTGVSLSPENLPLAIAAMNALVKSASSEELRALANSPSITAIRQVLSAGNSVL